MSEPREEYALGVDEAGRGPVLGPMVYGVCFCKVSYLNTLASLGVADSKTLTLEQREELFEKIKEDKELHYLHAVLSPEELSAKMLRRCDL